MDRKILIESRKIKKIIDFMSKHFDVDVEQEYQKVEWYDDKLDEVKKQIELLQHSYQRYEADRYSVPRNYLESNQIDLKKYVLESRDAYATSESLFQAGILTPTEYDDIRTYLWNNRPSQKYKLQQTYIPND